MQVSDLLDILVVTALIYSVLRVVRETRSAAAMRGLLTLILAGVFLYVIARALNLVTTTILFERFWIVAILVFLIVFQNEFRKALTAFGQLQLFRRIFYTGGLELDELLKAVRTFSRQKIGALICIERRNPLRVYAESGTSIDAVVSTELLRTIFMTYSPLHDGAVIVRGNRIIAAGCILPLADNKREDRKTFGTRHLAALGLAEETDAAVIVVSEETGTISLALAGQLERHHTYESLKEALEDLVDVKREEETTPQD